VPKTVKVGTMLEVPSLMWQMQALVTRVDFISIGTNDLMQFMFAADRSNTRLANRYDTLSPAVLNMIRFVVLQCREAGVEVSVCGEMAGKPLDALALMAVGCRNLSMSASGIGPVRSIIRSAALSQIEPFVLGLLSSDESSIRERLRAFARDRGIAVT
jgi:phosphotransferase system enzyme I (PtsP)